MVKAAYETLSDPESEDVTTGSVPSTQKTDDLPLRKSLARSYRMS